MAYQCKTCSALKDESQFYPQRTRLGHMVECRSCSLARTKRWVSQNRDRFRELNRAATHRYRQKDPRLRLLDYARRRAVKAGMEFDLVVDDLEWPTHCPVLGIEMQSLFGTGGGGRRDHSPSLDRIDNRLGYVKGNVVVVSWRVNRIKCDATAQELRRVADFYGNPSRCSTQAGEICLPTVQPSQEE